VASADAETGSVRSACDGKRATRRRAHPLDIRRTRGESMMTLMSRLLPAALALVSLHALAEGTLYQEGKATPLKSTYAYRGPDPWDKTKTITTVVFADQPIDAAAANAAADRGEAVSDQLRKANATRVELNIEDDGHVQNVNINAPGYSGSQSGSGWYTLKLVKNDAKRIEGSFVSNDEADKKDGRFYELRFAQDLAGAPDLGTPLPADGGEPAKAYRAYVAALGKGDVDALAKTMTKERSAEILSHRNDPDFKMMFAFIQQSALKNPKYSKGFVKGDTATLEWTGKDGDGNATTSTATMQKEAGAWRLAKESTSTHVQ
jgi:hypothetical protein